METLTEKQTEVLNFIIKYIRAHNYPPTMREMAEYFSISSKAVYDHLSALRKKKKIKMLSRGARTIELAEENFVDTDGFMDIPVLGNVAAGRRIIAEENYDGVIRMHVSVLKKCKHYFALKVCGDSMTGIGVMDGDTVIIEKHDSAKNGDVVVVDIDDGGKTLKRYFKQGSRIKLVSENPKYHPMYSTCVHILGKLSGVYRSYA